MSGIAPELYITARWRRVAGSSARAPLLMSRHAFVKTKQHICESCDKSPRRFVTSVQNGRTGFHSRAYFREVLCHYGHPLMRGSWRGHVMSRPDHSRRDLGETWESSVDLIARRRNHWYPLWYSQCSLD